MDGELAAERLSAISTLSATEDGVTRLPWTPEHKAALGEIKRWMEDAGLAAELDAAGTLVGRSPNPDDKPVILMGSHQDSVPNAGRFDGIMGIALACLAAKRFKGRWEELSVGIEVLAFADEEGVRFPTALIGPRALAGTLDPKVFDMTDSEGVTMRTAMAAFGADADRAMTLRRDPVAIAGYLEAHIEQGPVLEAANVPIGIVTAICGIARFNVTVTGETGHAGTVPMTGRRDALVGAARLIGEINTRALAEKNIRATVGTISVKPGAVNAVPAVVDFTLEVRADDDARRDRFANDVTAFAEETLSAAGLQVSISRTYEQRAVPSDEDLMTALADAAEETGHAALRLMSGATHDASAMADLCPTAMLFIPCRAGVSHRPDEYADAVSMGAAVDVLEQTIERISNRYEA
ncbi:MAG: M20 family metallo-hydrolase [Pseudomonadota bacterium]